ncbi:MAG: hypothetical protein KGN16_24245 [Burkholderiales bacterium]|nr:hypothetical protein [Burkholderiales bacterium]
MKIRQFGSAGDLSREEHHVKVVVNVNGTRAKYSSKAAAILKAAGALGDAIDVSGMTRPRVHAKIAAAPGVEPILILGGYDLVPTFVLSNPTLHVERQQEGAAGADKNIPSDGPYGGTPGNQAQQLVPTRAVARLPDSSAKGAADFLALVSGLASPAKTPAGGFQECAAEFVKPSRDVATAAQIAASLLVSPPVTSTDPALPGKIKGEGRIHILLHGANYDPDWADLWGHTAGSKDWPRGLSAPTLAAAAFSGSVVTFSSCYAAMIDLSKKIPVRDATNQVSLACLKSGAKAVFAVTRSNWIGSDGSSLGPGLARLLWTGLVAGKTAGQALIDAKRQLASEAMKSGTQADLPYVYKTLAQAQLYGNPEATL